VCLGVLVLLAVIASPPAARAQVLIPGDRPGDEQLPPPPFEPPKDAERPILPPYRVPEQPDTGAIAAGVRVFVRQIRITGNRAVSTEELAKIAAPYENRALSFSDLQELRDKLTLAYVERGYVTSGATLPEQTITDGVVEIRIVEGELENVEIETDGRFRPSYIRKRIVRGQRGPVNVFTLEERLQILQQDPRIGRIEAQLVPGDKRGFSLLRVRVAETVRYHLGADFSNYRNPSIGSLGGQIWGGYGNLFGVGDGYFARVALTEGLRQVEGRFEVPLTVYDTLLTLRYQGSWADVVAEPIASAFDIDSRSQTLGVELRQPVYRTLRTSVETFLRGELRRAESFLDGSGFSFTPGPVGGESKVSALRWGLEWQRRTRAQAFAARSLLSFGIDALDATVNPRDTPDGRFVSWLAQLQWARRLPWRDVEILARFNTQIANDPLLPLEQFAMGGRYTVRGYRENTLVRDNGLVGSIEARLPIFRRVEPLVHIELVPFFDAGHSWNTERPSLGSQTLLSVGIGTRMSLTRWGDFEFYWGHRIKDVPEIGEYNLQDDGIVFRLSVGWP
jgi:hemolysin activation/secretion protein